MNQNSTVVFSAVHSAALAHAVSNKTLGEGSVVFVRVLKNNGGNTYTVSFAGGRFSIRSEINLKVGATFSAKITLSGDKILLVQQKEAASKTMAPAKNAPLFDKDGRALNNALASYLENLKVPPDETSYTLLNQIRLLGMKFDSQLVKKLRLIASNSTDAKNAAETALILEKKGMKADKNAIEAITKCGEKSHEKKEQPFENGTTKVIAIADAEDSLEKTIKTALEKYIRALTNARPPYDALDKTHKTNGDGTKQGETRHPTILALFNHAGFDLQSPLFFGSWIKIPFEMEGLESEGQAESKISGFIALFLNPLKKSAEKCTIKIDFNDKKYAFSLSFKNSMCIKIRSNLNAEKIGEIPIEKCDIHQITDFDADYENIILEETV